ncbi:chromosome segregation protein SMC [bacterium]|nr:chromosome segregation protein SMC [bacterium]
MGLTKLELFGFKSFMNPITLEFNKGITAILGPNGCGKTNIVDSVRWALGERSAQQLRSDKMEDVIFNGTQEHKPVGYAKVNLTLDNEKGTFPLEYSEIMITRKVYRSGISEYFINKTPCRLKDIKELFADTGTGSHSYAVIEQEMMDFVLNDSHGERKEMFEEAAGIVKYRMRREEAKRKLKLTQSDLLRLDDILEELGKQVNSLRYQVGKTKRYKRLKERIRDWELLFIRNKLAAFLEEKGKNEKELYEIQQLSGKETVSTGELERELEARKFELIEIEKNNTEFQNKRYDVRKNIQSVEEKIIQISEQRREMERRVERAEKEIEEARKRMEKITDRIDIVASESDEIYVKMEDGKAEIVGYEKEYDEISSRVNALKIKLAGLKQTQLSFIQDQARLKNDIEHHKSVLGEIDSRISGGRDQVLALEEESGRLSRDKEELQSEVVSMQNYLQENKRKRRELSEEADKTRGKLSDLEDLISERKTRLARLNSEYDLYTQMIQEFEGFPSGARHLLKNGSTHIKGPIAELLNVDEKLRTALESVLGGMLDAIVVSNFSGALELVKELETKHLGSARFLIESYSADEKGKIGNINGLLGKLSSFVKVKDGVKGFRGNFFAKILVFEETEQAVDFISSYSGSLPYDVVSLSGVFLRSSGEVYFSGMEENEISLLGRSERVEKIKKKIEGLDSEIKSYKNKQSNYIRKQEAIQNKIKIYQDEFLVTEANLSNKRDELQEKERNYIMKREKCNLLAGTLEELEESRNDILSQLEEAKLSIEMQQSSDDTLQISSIDSDWERTQIKKDETESSITQRKVALASFQGEYEKKKEEIRGLQEMQKHFGDVIQRRNVEITSLKSELVESSERLKGERAIVKDLFENERFFQSKIDNLHDNLEEKRRNSSEIERNLKERQRRRDNLVSSENRLKVNVSSLETKMNDSIDVANDLYGEDYRCYLEGIQIPPSEEENGVSYDMLAGEKGKLERLGPVNLAAIEEYNEKKKRLDFLEYQKEDLIKAREELEEAISKINTKARRLFKETFDLVKGYFSETFEILFEGGEATLSLSENSDPLEADINISARPKGKRLQDISLLSGGERALTSLAILFALYKVKPSPFCILDEVDAPLDDVNVKRFIRMVKNFSTETQFIVITHNKGTMEMADSLLGVTMQEKGVSTVVGVDMESVEDIISKNKKSSNKIKESAISRN